MFDQERQPVRRRRSLHVARRLLLIAGRVLGRVTDLLIDDLRTLRVAGRLIVGVGAILVGMMSFASDRYCDGTTASSYAACTRPSTYYYYPWWAILLVLFGVCMVTLWALRRVR